MKTNDLTQYKKLSEQEHVLKRSGMYIGSTTKTVMDFFVVDHENKMVMESIKTTPAFIKLIDEIISNSVDEHIRNGSVTRIDVDYSTLTGEISISDNGGIPVKLHPEHGIYIPTMIFGQLRTGSNFSDESRITAGLNGLGSSLVNIFSKKFIVETCDGENKFTQIFSDNMTESTDPYIEKCDINGTKITFIPDYDRLNCQFDRDSCKRIERRAYDVAACNPKIKVFINGVLINIKKFSDYVSMYTENFVSDSNDQWEIAVSHSSDDTFRHISFVNGVDTYNGGTHVDYISGQICEKIREFIKKKHKIDVKPNNIKQQLFLFINCTINVPAFNSQTKEYMNSDVKDFGSEFLVSDKFINKIVQSEIIQQILDWAMSQQKRKELSELKKLENKKKVYKSEKYFPAINEKKFLIGCEGASAIGGLSPSLGRKNIGYYELKGKPLNCWDVSISKFKDNKELSDLYAVIKAEEYDYFICGTDADLDGSHIRMLLIAFVLKYLPEYANKFGYLETPVIGIKKNGKLIRWYYSLEESYELSSGENATYYKGLGTWDSKDLKHVVNVDGLENMIKLLDLSDNTQYENWLANDKVEKRKELLNNHIFSIAKL